MIYGTDKTMIIINFIHVVKITIRSYNVIINMGQKNNLPIRAGVQKVKIFQG